jgi:hypothetical protein
MQGAAPHPIIVEPQRAKQGDGLLRLQFSPTAGQQRSAAPASLRGRAAIERLVFRFDNERGFARIVGEVASHATGV